VNQYRIASLALCVAVSLVAAGCGGGDGRPDGVDAPTPASIGTYDDPYDFKSFGDELDYALSDTDLEFFLDNVGFPEVSCAQDAPPPPASCAGKPAEATVEAILVGVWEGEDFYLDAVGYEEFMLDFLMEYDRQQSDAYGGPEPKLYAYGIIRPEFATAPGDEAIQAVVTRISGGSAPEREALLLASAFDGERWAITQVVLGPAAFLDSYGPKLPAGSELDTIFEFWAPWQE